MWSVFQKQVTHIKQANVEYKALKVEKSNELDEW